MGEVGRRIKRVGSISIVSHLIADGNRNFSIAIFNAELDVLGGSSNN